MSDSWLELDDGTRLPLEAPVTSLGRDRESVDLHVHDPKVSRRHLWLVRVAGKPWVLLDRNSSQGVEVERAPVTRCVLSDGDRIRVGETMLRFCVGDSGSASSPTMLASLLQGKPPGRWELLGGSEVDEPAPRSLLGKLSWSHGACRALLRAKDLQDLLELAGLLALEGLDGSLSLVYSFRQEDEPVLGGPLERFEVSREGWEYSERELWGRDRLIQTALARGGTQLARDPMRFMTRPNQGGIQMVDTGSAVVAPIRLRSPLPGGWADGLVLYLERKWSEEPLGLAQAREMDRLARSCEAWLDLHEEGT